MKVRVARRVQAPPRQVFDQVVDPSHWPWGGRVEHVAGAGVGATYQVVDRVGPHEVVSTLTITALEAPRLLAWRAHHAAYDHRSELRIVPRGQGALLVAVDEDRWHHVPWWARWSARQAMRRDMQRRLAAIDAAASRREGGPGDQSLFSNSV